LDAEKCLRKLIVCLKMLTLKPNIDFKFAQSY